MPIECCRDDVRLHYTRYVLRDDVGLHYARYVFRDDVGLHYARYVSRDEVGVHCVHFVLYILSGSAECPLCTVETLWVCSVSILWFRDGAGLRTVSIVCCKDVLGLITAPLCVLHRRC